MDFLGIYTQTTTSTSTSLFAIDLPIGTKDVGISTLGNVVVTGLLSNYNSYTKYFSFVAYCSPDGSISNTGNCNLYEASNISGTTVTLDFVPTGTIDSSSYLRVNITPGSSSTIKWTVYFKDCSYNII
jgi:hypothetical protein